MATRQAACGCGQLHLETTGEPVRISMCHCLACQRRTGSAFSLQARWPSADVRIEGRSTAFERVSDSGEQTFTFHFCPDCGATVYYVVSEVPDLVAVPVGAFADPSFPQPAVSVWETRKHAWVAVPEPSQHRDR
jgi:hypothetical protein